MSLSGLLDLVAAEPAVAAALGQVGAPAVDLSAPAALRPLLVAALATRGERPVLAITATGRETEELVGALDSLLAPGEVADFPAWETLPHERLSPRADTVGRRLAALRRLRHPRVGGARLRVLVAPVRSLLQPLAAGLAEVAPVELRAGEESDFEAVLGRLVELGYTRTELVERRGEFAVRGGIVDVFPPTSEHPVRVEFWGDRVEDVRTFGAADQRSLGTAPDGLFAPPCRELLLTDEVRRRARELAVNQPQLSDMLDRIAEGMPVEGMEALSPVLVDGMALLLDELPAGTHLVVCDPERVRSRASDLVRTGREFLEASWSAAAGGGRAPIDLGAAAYRTLSEVRQAATELGIPWWTVSPFAPDSELDADALRVDARPAEAYRGDMPRALADIRRLLRERWRVVLVTEGHGPAERLAELLRGADIGARLTTDIAEPPDPAVVHVSTGHLESGFVCESLRLAVLGEADLVGQRASTKDMRRLPSRRRGALDPLQLAAGDYVVHEQHGVGRYVEMTRRTVSGATREYLVLEYARGDRLYVPTDSLEQLTRYSGGEQPSLDRLGGSDWAKRKGRARKAVREIAGELIRLYSARMSSPGHAFAPDTPWQRELEDAFPYAETPGDLRRRGLRQDGDRGAGRLQGSARREAGGGAGANHPACPAALLHFLRAVRVIPGQRAGAQPVQLCKRAAGSVGRTGRRDRGRGHRDASAAAAVHPLPRPRTRGG
jgi:transcription-repair coupling factor (superfamily II helicase)